jgi:hypothetical protein
MKAVRGYKSLVVWQLDGLAEGHQRRSRRAFVNHVSIALGSQGELETQLEATRRLKFCSETELSPIVEAAEEVGRMLFALSKSLRKQKAEKTVAFEFEVPD